MNLAPSKYIRLPCWSLDSEVYSLVPGWGNSLFYMSLGILKLWGMTRPEGFESLLEAFLEFLIWMICLWTLPLGVASSRFSRSKVMGTSPVSSKERSATCQWKIRQARRQANCPTESNSFSMFQHVSTCFNMFQHVSSSLVKLQQICHVRLEELAMQCTLL